MYYIGECEKDAADYRGWLLGSFVESGPRKVDEVEVKYWQFGKGTNDHPLKTSSVLECTILLAGKVEAIIEGATTTLGAGQYVILHPNTPNNLVSRVLEDTKGITIKAPSDPSAKKIMEAS